MKNSDVQMNSNNNPTMKFSTAITLETLVEFDWL